MIVVTQPRGRLLNQPRVGPVDLGLAAVVLVGHALLPVVALVVGAPGKRRHGQHSTRLREPASVAPWPEGLASSPHREPQPGSDQRGRCQPDGELREPVSGELVA
jgi:hypothetical protein